MNEAMQSRGRPFRHRLSSVPPFLLVLNSVHTLSLVIVTPALNHLHNFEPGELSTYTFTREAEAMHIQSALYPRSTIETNSGSGSGGGVGKNTIIFIVLGVGWSCSFIVLCWLVRRSIIRVAAQHGLRDQSFIAHRHLCALPRQAKSIQVSLSLFARFMEAALQRFFTQSLTFYYRISG